MLQGAADNNTTKNCFVSCNDNKSKDFVQRSLLGSQKQFPEHEKHSLAMPLFWNVAADFHRMPPTMTVATFWTGQFLVACQLKQIAHVSV